MGLGLAIGIQHAFEPDHMAAVSTQIVKSKFVKTQLRTLIKDSITKSSLLGIAWGAGHATTLVLIGLLVNAFAVAIHDHVFYGFEFVVGAMLVILGITTLSNKKIRIRHKHPHKHQDGSIHLDEHIHNNSNHIHTHKSYLIGLIHGLAGSGVIVVLTATSLNSIDAILGFVGIFGIGSILGMMFVGSIVGIPLALGNKIKLIKKIMRYSAGIFSLVIGFNIMYQIALIGILF